MFLYLNDIQVISDVYKSEVIEVAKYLNVPIDIIERIPKGDVYDSRNDEEMIGAPYWFLELYMNFIYRDNDDNHNSFTIEDIGNLYQYYSHNINFNIEDINFFETCKVNIENLRRTNKHKYLVGSPAIILNTYREYKYKKDL